VTALDGKDVNFVCRAVGAPNPNITWIYNGEQHTHKLTHTHTHTHYVIIIVISETNFIEATSSNRFQILENGDLTILGIKESDSGKYKCIRSNEAGSVEAEAHLGVLVRTQITQPPVDTIVLLGLTASLQCRVSSDANVKYTIQWSKQ